MSGHGYYDATLGRFLSRDPIGFAGGLNLYNYTTNPVNEVDPAGLYPTQQEIVQQAEAFVKSNLRAAGFGPWQGYKVVLDNNFDKYVGKIENLTTRTRAFKDKGTREIHLNASKLDLGAGYYKGIEELKKSCDGENDALSEFSLKVYRNGIKIRFHEIAKLLVHENYHIAHPEQIYLETGELNALRAERAWIRYLENKYPKHDFLQINEADTKHRMNGWIKGVLQTE